MTLSINNSEMSSRYFSNISYKKDKVDFCE